jgi:hypothetical protein
MQFDESQLSDEILSILGKLRTNVKEARDTVELQTQMIQNKPPTYIQTRAKKSVEFHEQQMSSIDKEFSDKRKKLEKALEELDEEKQKRESYHKSCIEKSKKDIEHTFKPIGLVRAEIELDKAIIARDRFLESVKNNSPLPIQEILPTHKSNFSNVCASPIPPPPPEKIFMWYGEPVGEWEYNYRVKKFGKPKKPLKVVSVKQSSDTVLDEASSSMPSDLCPSTGR